MQGRVISTKYLSGLIFLLSRTLGNCKQHRAQDATLIIFAPITRPYRFVYHAFSNVLNDIFLIYNMIFKRKKYSDNTITYPEINYCTVYYGKLCCILSVPPCISQMLWIYMFLWQKDVNKMEFSNLHAVLSPIMAISPAYKQTNIFLINPLQKSLFRGCKSWTF